GTAVDLDPETRQAVAGVRCSRLETQPGGIGMSADDAETGLVKRLSAEREGDDGRAGARDEISAAGLELPALAFVQFGIAVPAQQLGGGRCRMPRTWAGVDEIE